MSDVLARLKQLNSGFSPLNGLDSAARRHIAFGVETIDRRLDGGLLAGRLHEVLPARSADAARASAFAGALAHRAGRQERQVVWIRQTVSELEAGGLYAPGLAELGFDPAGLTVIRARNHRTLLLAALEAIRCTPLGAVVIEAWGNSRPLDLTATRRLTFAAEKSGVTPILLWIAAKPTASAAITRWQVRSAPSRPLAANAPGLPVFDLTLLRNRAGASGQRWRVEWDHEHFRFRPAAPLSGGVAALPAGRPAETSRQPVARTG
ncbi:MAG: hypothetical protein C0606_04535 [Hyphomicrobiales bacterium]|nr:MAG: hypothetical protein C0606_04535 [Hyphomicrobiales bacterium]